jgi:hypothetical protein
MTVVALDWGARLQALREVLPLVHSKMDQQQLLRHAARYITATKSLLHQAQALGAMAGWPEPQQAAVRRLLSQDSYPADGLGQGVRSTAISLQGPPSFGSEGHSSPSKGTKGLLASGQDMEKLTHPLAAVALKGQLPGGLEGSSTSGTSGTANTRSLEGNTSSVGLPELTGARLGLRCPGSLDGARPLGDLGTRFLPGDPSMASSGHGSDALQPMQIDSPSRLPDFMSRMEARDPSVRAGGGSPQLGPFARTQSQSLPPGIPRTPFGEGPVSDIASSHEPDIRSRSMSQPTEYEAILRSGGTGSKPTFVPSQPRKSRLASRGSVPVHLPSTGRPAPPLLQRAPSWGPPAVPSERWGLWETSAPMPLADPGFSAFNMAQPQETLQAPPAGGTTAPHLGILGGGPSEYEKPHRLPVMGPAQGPGVSSGARPGSPMPQMLEQPPWTPPRAPDTVLQFSPWQGLGTMQYMYSPPLAGVPQQAPGQQQQGGSFVQQVGDMNVNRQGYIMHLHPPTSQQAPQGFPYPAYGFSLPTSPMGPAPAHPYVGPPGSLLTYSAVLPGQASGYAVYSPDQVMGSTGTVEGIPAQEGYPGFRGGQGINTMYGTGQAYNLQGQEGMLDQLQYAPGPPQQQMQYNGGTSSAQQDMLMQQQMSYQMQQGLGGGGVAGGMVQYNQPGVQYMQPGAQGSAVPGFPSQMQVHFCSMPLYCTSMCSRTSHWASCLLCLILTILQLNHPGPRVASLWCKH